MTPSLQLSIHTKINSKVQAAKQSPHLQNSGLYFSTSLPCKLQCLCHTRWHFGCKAVSQRAVVRSAIMQQDKKSYKLLQKSGRMTLTQEALHCNRHVSGQIKFGLWLHPASLLSMRIRRVADHDLRHDCLCFHGHQLVQSETICTASQAVPAQ